MRTISWLLGVAAGPRLRHAWLAAGALVALGAAPVRATTVHGLAALHHDGQTFLTWTSPGASGWIYRVYASPSPMTSDFDLDVATLVGTVGDSTWCDRRLSSIQGKTYAYVIQAGAQPLGSSQGLFVVTPPGSGSCFYAVTAQRVDRLEDRMLVPGANSLVEPVFETAGAPQPVYQRTLQLGAVRFEVYTLWVDEVETQYVPAMANRPSLAYDCGVVRGGQPPANALMVRLHARGGNFVCPVGSGQPGEWLLTLDDFVPTSAQASFWYGYHVDYDLDQQVHDPPEAGVVADYTMCRVVYTIEWARRTFPVDTARVYAMGTSMGGIGSMMLALRHPNLLAGVFALVPKFDFSYLADPVATSQFNEGNPLRYEVDRLWCPVAKDLPSSEGVGTYEALNAGYLAALHDAVALPPIIAFNGKNDNVVGWAEKIPFYRTMNAHRHGGYFFFDQRAHVGGPAPAWGPMEDPRYLYRFRLDRSYPALSNCSASQNPGDGLPTSGDSVGAINASVEWDTSIVDQPATWQVTLRLRDLQTSWGVIPAPGLVMVDVTPRRLQLFLTRPYRRFLCTIRQLSDTTLVGLGTVMADSRGLVTVPNVIVRKPGTVLTLTPVAKTKSLEAEVVSPAPARLRISLSRNPVVGEGTARVEWSGEGEGEVDLIGVSGRLERQLLRGPTSGTTVLRLDGGGLPAGVYFLRARQGGETAVERVVVLR